jgi:hypothetical protein
MRHKIKVDYSYDVHIPDGDRCDGKDVGQRPCTWWDPSHWSCRSGEVEHYDHKKKTSIEHVGPHALHRLVSCVKKFGRKSA